MASLENGATQHPNDLGNASGKTATDPNPLVHIEQDKIFEVNSFVNQFPPDHGASKLHGFLVFYENNSVMSPPIADGIRLNSSNIGDAESLRIGDVPCRRLYHDLVDHRLLLVRHGGRHSSSLASKLKRERERETICVKPKLYFPLSIFFVQVAGYFAVLIAV